MLNSFSRSQLLLGEEAMEKLKNAKVLVFGVGGVGSYTVEALARSGIGAIDIVDNDEVSQTNINRQLIALNSTVGKKKVEVMRDRIYDINPDCRVNIYPVFITRENAADFNYKEYDYVVDAIDTVTAKLALIQLAYEAGTPVISAMGAGNKLDPAAFEVADIYETSVCPLARIMRKELRKRNVEHLKVVYSREEARTPAEEVEELPEGSSRRQTPGSLAFVPSVAGLIVAGEIILDISGADRGEKQ